MKNFNSFFYQLTAMPKRLAMVLTVLFTVGVGQMWGETYELDATTHIVSTVSNYSTTEATLTGTNNSQWKVKGYGSVTNTSLTIGKGGANYLKTPTCSEDITSVTVTWTGNTSYYLALQTTSGNEIEAQQNQSSDFTYTFDVSGKGYKQLQLVGRRSSGTSNAAAVITKVVVEYGSSAPAVTHTVTWKVNGETYTTGSPSTSVSGGGKVTKLPTDPTLDCSGKVFVGWTKTPIDGTTNTKPSVLFTTAATSPAINKNTTFHAVFATETGGGSTTDTYDWESTSPGNWTVDSNIARTASQGVSSSYAGKINTNNTYVTYTKKVAVTEFSFQFKRTSTNSNYYVYIETSTDNSNWSTAATYAMNSFGNGTYTSKSQTFDGNTELYVRFHCYNTTATRYVDNVSITYGGGTTYTDYTTTCTTKSTYSVTSTLSHVTAAGGNPTTVTSEDEDLTLTYLPEDTWNLPATISVTMGGAPLSSETDYDWDNGDLRIAPASGFTDDIVVTINGWKELAPPSGLNVSNITSSGATLAWNAVTHATSYTVQVYGENDEIIAEYTDLTQTTKEVSGLESDTYYIWAVTAIGDGTTYTDSEESETAEFTTASATCTVTYDANGGEGTVTDTKSPYDNGATVTVVGNYGKLTKDGYAFTGWNTAADGSGTTYNARDEFVITTNTTLYAQWCEAHWVLVTNKSEIEDDTRIIIAAKDNNVALSTTQNENNRGQATITKKYNTVTFGADVQTLVLTKVLDYFALYVLDKGFLYAASSSYNHLKTGNNTNGNGNWEIAVSPLGVASIFARGTNTNNQLKYNSTSSLFSCYGSGNSQKDVVIYKEVCVQDQYNVNEPKLTNATAANTNPTTVASNATSLTLNYSADAGYLLPETITVKMGGATLVSGTDYTWNKSTGELTFTVTGFYGDIDIKIVAEADPCYGFAMSTVTATSTTNTITLTWTAVEGATDYKVRIGEEAFKSTSELTYEFTGLEANTSYNWEVQAIKGTCQASQTGSTTTQKESYTITWSAAGEETTTTVTQGDAVVLPDTPTSCSDEYTTFVGWFTAAAGIETNPSNDLPGTQVTASTIPTGNTTYYAVWADGSGSGEEVKRAELDFSSNNWGLPEGSSKKTFSEEGISYSDGTHTITMFASSDGWYYNETNKYLLFGEKNSRIQLPTFTHPVSKIVVTGKGGASTKVIQNIFVGETAVSTETTGATETNTYNIANNYQTAGTVYSLKITNAYNSQVTKIEIYEKTSAATGYISSCCQSQAVVTVAPTENELILNIDGTASTNVHISQEGAGNGKYNQPTISPAEGASLNWTGNYKQAPYDLTFTATKAGTYTITADFTETAAACPKYGTATINVLANPILVVSTPTISSMCGVAGTPAAVTIDSRYLTGAKLTAQVATTAGNGTFEICKTQDGTFATTNLTEIAAGQADKTTATIYVRYVAGVDENTAATGTLTILDGTTSQTVDLSTTPTCGTSIRMTASDANSIRVTTANGQWTRTQTAIHLRGAYLLQGLQSGQGAKVVLSSSNSNFKFVKPDVQSAGTATFESDKIITEIWEQDIHLVYTPTTYNANETTTITAQVITFGGSTVHATSTIEAYGRSFPKTFVLALNTGDGWVALPADMIAPFGTSCNTGVGTHDPYPITVDNNENPTTATSAPTRAMYKGAARNTPNTNPWTIQLESNELPGYFLRGSSGNATTIYNSDVKESESVKWTFSTNDNITYQLSQTTVTDGRKLGYNGTDKVMGQYLANSYKYDFRILPVENTCTYHIEPVMEFMGFAANDNPQVKIKYDGTTTYLISTDNQSTWSEITGVQDCKDLIFNLDHNTFGNKNIWLKPAGDLCVETVSSTSLLVPAPVIIEWYANTRLVHRQVAAAGTDITMPKDEIEPCEGKEFVGWTTTADLQDAADAPDDLFEELATTLSEDAKYYAVFATEVAGGGTQEIEATLSFKSTDQRTSFSTTQQVWEQNGITLTNNKANSTSDVADYANPARFYKGSTIGIEVSGKISQIVFDCDDKEYASNLKTSIGSSATYSSTTVTAKLDGTSASFSTALSAQVRLNSLTVTYTAEGGPAYTNYSTTCGTYTITYYGFTGGYSTICDDNPAVVEIPIGATFTIVDCTPTADPKNLGRKFAGTWNTATDGTGTEYQPGASFMPTSDITLYAQWTLDMTEDLTIPAGIEDLASTDITVTGGKTLTLPQGTTTINSLNLRGGLENGKYTMPNVYVPTGATLVRNIETINLDLIVNAANYYPVAVPFATPIIKENIDYLDPTLRNASTYKTHYVFKTYDGAARAQNGEDREKNWVVVDENTSLQPGVGYIVKALTYPTKDTATIRIPMIVSNDWFADGELTQVGETSRNAIAVIAHTGAASQATNGNRHAGWNFVASPYLSKFAGNNIASEGNLDYINGAIHINGEFAQGGEEVPYVTVPAYDFSYYMSHKLSEVVLNPEWSFFVQIGTSGTMDFTTEGRQQAPEALRAAASYGNTRMEANIAILQGTHTADHTGLIIDDRYTNDYEIGADLEKMFGSAYNTTIYTISNSTRLAYNALPYSQATKAIPLGFRAAQEGEYTIQLTSQDYIAGVERIMLKDQLTGISTDLMYFDYTFSSEKTQDDQRFVLYIVQRENTATDISNIIDETEKSNNRKVLYNNQLYIIQNGNIYNGMGQMVK